MLWPLAIYEKNHMSILSVQDDALEFHCNKRSRGNRTSLSPSIATVIDMTFGKQFRLNVEKAAKKKLTFFKIQT
jgi:hypothetical protein